MTNEGYVSATVLMDGQLFRYNVRNLPMGGISINDGQLSNDNCTSAGNVRGRYLSKGHSATSNLSSEYKRLPAECIAVRDVHMINFSDIRFSENRAGIDTILEQPVRFICRILTGSNSGNDINDEHPSIDMYSRSIGRTSGNANNDEHPLRLSESRFRGNIGRCVNDVHLSR